MGVMSELSIEIDETTEEIYQYIQKYKDDPEINDIRFRIRQIWYDPAEWDTYIHYGHESYDIDHRGLIGAGIVSIDNADRDTIKEQVRECYNQIMDQMSIIEDPYAEREE